MNKPVYSSLSLLEISKNSIVWLLVWLCETKLLWRKGKIMLHGYRLPYSLHKNGHINVDFTKDV